MIMCDAVRAALALEPESADSIVSEHTATCPSCAAYRLRTQTLDVLLRHEMHWEAPAELTNRLMMMAAAPWAAAPMVVARPQRWYVRVVYVLTLVILGLSLALAWQMAVGITAQLGLFDSLNQILAMPGWALQQLTAARPESRYVIEFVLRARDQLMWLLLAAVLWVALERVNPRFTFNRRQVS